MPETIYFYHKDEPYYEFSNFAAFPIFLRGQTWPTSEHYFQAQKFAGTPLEDQVRQAATPGDAFCLGGDHKDEIRRGWHNEIKESVMREALRAKFTQHPELARLLVDTGDAPIVEASPHDAYWGYGPDRSGENRLGCLLMELRAQLRQG